MESARLCFREFIKNQRDETGGNVNSCLVSPKVLLNIKVRAAACGVSIAILSKLWQIWYETPVEARVVAQGVKSNLKRRCACPAPPCADYLQAVGCGHTEVSAVALEV